MISTRAAKRIVKTVTDTRYASNGVLKAIRRNVTTGGGSVTIPAKISGGVIKNAGSSVLAFNFDSDLATDYFTLEPGQVSPVLPLVDRVTINAKAIGGNTVAECIFWG